MEWLAVSSALLLVVVVALAIVTLSLVRQIGVLHERTAPAGGIAMATELRDGDVVEGLEPYFKNVRRGAPLLLCLFVALDCPLCRSLHRHFAAACEQLEVPGVWVVAQPPGASIDAYARDEGIPSADLIAAPELAMRLNVQAAPALVGFSNDDRLLGRELVSRPSDLERIATRWLRETSE